MELRSSVLLLVLLLNFYYNRVESVDILGKEFRVRFPYEIQGSTLDGGPILLVPFGEWNIPEAIRRDEKEKLRILYYEIFEKLENLTKSANGKIKSGISIFDMEKYSFTQGVHPEANAFIVDMTNDFENKYDHRILKRWYLINTPAPFQLGYNFLKYFLPEQTRNKWQVFGSRRYQWQWEIFKDISPDQLPQQYGGIKDNY